MEPNRKRLEMRAVRVWAAYILSICCFSGAGCLWAQSYPAIKPLQRTFVVPDVAKANVSVNIESTKVLHSIACSATRQGIRVTPILITAGISSVGSA
jgi:hypothetical protein